MDRPLAAYKGDKPYVFVCYAHEDGDVVYPEMAWLQDQKVRLWYDEGISGGHVWRQEIYNALESSDCVLCYLSYASLSSSHCCAV